MMKRKTVILAGIFLCFSIISLVGCGNKNPSSAGSSNQSEANTWSDENVDENGWT